MKVFQTPPTPTSKRICLYWEHWITWLELVSEQKASMVFLRELAERGEQMHLSSPSPSLQDQWCHDLEEEVGDRNQNHTCTDKKWDDLYIDFKSQKQYDSLYTHTHACTMHDKRMHTHTMYTSLPWNATGSASFCIGVGVAHFMAWHASHSTSTTPCTVRE